MFSEDFPRSQCLLIDLRNVGLFLSSIAGSEVEFLGF